jgi:ADP-heptose:LPS heptosyltransferase
MHISKNFIALVNALISDNKEVPYSKTCIKDEEVVLTKVRASDAEKNRVWNIVRKEYPDYDKGINHIVLMNPNSGDVFPQRRWPFPKFANLIKKILDYDPGAVVLVTGSPAERKECGKLTDMVESRRCVNFTGKVDFKDLPVLYSISSFMLTNDSGPSHFSAITDMPSFVLFGPETPALYGSLGNSTPIYAGLACSPCVTAANHRKTPCKDNVCLQIISEDEVFETIKEHLQHAV